MLLLPMRKLKKMGSLCLWLFFSISTAHAVPTNFSDVDKNTFRFGLSDVHYFTQSADALPAQRVGYFAASVGYDAYRATDKLEAEFNGEAMLGLHSGGYHSYDVHEAYIATKPSSWQLVFGRKREDWSTVDSYWSLGLFQPRFRWDYLQEQQDGLAGFFLHYKAPDNSSELTVFATPLFIPELGTSKDISGGVCKTNSPWFSCPSSTVLLFNQATTLNLTLHFPGIRDVLDNPGTGISYRVGNPEHGLWSRASFAYKPMNQILLNYIGQLNLSTLTLPIDVYTRVLYHQIYAADVGIAGANTKITGSVIQENTKADTPASNWNIQTTKNATVASGLLQQNLHGRGLASTQAEISYIHVEGGNAPDSGSFATSSPTGIFEPRYMFSDAYSIALLGPILESWAGIFKASVKFIYIPIHKENIFVSDFFYNFSSRWMLNAGLDMLGSTAADNVDIVSKFQHNSRARGGLYYVF